MRVPVFVVLPPRTLLLDVAGPLEALRRANAIQGRVRFDVRYVGPARVVTTSIGLAIPNVDPLPDVLPDEAMIVLTGSVDQVMWPVGVTSAPRDRREQAGREVSPTGAVAAHGITEPEAGSRSIADAAGEAAIVDWLRGAVRPGHTLVSICSGAVLAARAGLLDGFACTTHHDTCAALARIAPAARVLENRLYVVDGQRLSSAGVTAGIDLMLFVIGRLVDRACAMAVARYLVVYLRRNGADPQLSPWLDGRNHLHPAVHRVQDAISADPTRPWTVDALADIAGASARHLSRLFHEHVGMSTTDYRNRLRVALARELLGQTSLDMERVAERAGFASTRQLRRAWRRWHPTPPRDARSGRAGESASPAD